jgi:predicted DNA-binding WGR domain protein
MRRFEFVEGSSSKFWQIEQSGTSLTVKFGKLGANGQTQLKSLATDAAALKEQDKLVAEKLKKGYVEVTAGQTALSAAAPAPAPATASAITSPAPAPVVAAPVAVPSSPPPLAPSSAPAAVSGSAPVPVAQEEDGVFWTDALKKRVFPRRGGMAVHVTPLKAAKKAWTDVKAGWAQRQNQVATTKELEARLAAEAPSAGSVEEDAALVAVLTWVPTYSIPSVVDAPVDLLIGAAGYPHAVSVILTALERHVDGKPQTVVPGPSTTWQSNFHEQGRLLGLPRLRALLTVASEADYSAARDAALALRASGTDAQKAASSFLFPTEKAWVAQDLPLLAQGGRFPCLLSSVSDAAVLKGLTVNTHYLYGSRWSSESEDGAATLIDGCGLSVAGYLASEKPGYADSELLRTRFSTLGSLGCDEAFKALIESLDQKEAQAALAETSARQPRRALRLLGEAAVHRGRTGDVARSLLSSLVRRFPTLVAEVAKQLGAETAKLLEALYGEAAGGAEDARADELPPVLRSPPWTQARKAASPVVLDKAPAIDLADKMSWASGEREEWKQREGYSASNDTDSDLMRLINDNKQARAAQLAVCPEELAVRLAPLTTLSHWNDEAWFFPIAARHELNAVLFFEKRMEGDFRDVLPALLPYGVARFAPKVAEALAEKRSLRALARAWLMRHPEHAVAGLLGAALGKLGRPRKLAEAALRTLAQAGQSAVVLEVAQRAGVKDAVAALLTLDPLDLLPAKMPKLPGFADAAALPRPLLKARKAALPVNACEALLTMLAISPLDEPYAGLALVKELCEPASLAHFAWELFQAWLINGAPSKELWCMNSLGHFGDDACARKLASLVREWPGEAAHARAVAGLDVLAAVGTDVALMHLNGIALKVKFKGLQGKAQEKIETIAEARGLTREELEDRLAPDLGLDEDGSMVLDFGPRHFRVGFDEQLRPFVKDAEGSRLKDLPKPKQSDEAAKAEAASARWSQLKKDAKTSAGLQILRLELCMCGQRRFAASDFLELFVRHPLIFHVVRRLVWAVYDEQNKPGQTFRVAEDRTLADASDSAFTLSETAKVGIPHPLELDPAVTAKWSQVLGDYEIVQPFAQLGRPTYTASEEERKAKALDRVKGLKLPTGKVLGLEQRRWRRGAPQDGGVACWMEKRLPDGKIVTLDLDPGLYTGMLSESPEQTLGSVTIGGEWTRYQKDRGTEFGALSPIVFSELVNDLERLRS